MASYSELANALAAIVTTVHAGKALSSESTLFQHAERLCVDAARGIIRPVPWTHFTRAELPSNAFSDKQLRAISMQTGLPLEDLKNALATITEGREVWCNSRYQVLIFRDKSPVWLTIKHVDQSVQRSWRDLQRIKNELLGEEWEAVELFPQESRLVDQANQYHLWALDHRFDFGMGERAVTWAAGIGERQEPLEEPVPDDRVLHLIWCRRRAFDLLELNEPEKALGSFISDLSKHDHWGNDPNLAELAKAGFAAYEKGPEDLSTWMEQVK